MVLLIGLDAADWKLISEKIASGALPNLARLVTTGSSGPLRSIHPLFSPALWSTIATGKRPYEHGITGFTLSDDAGNGLKSYDSSLRNSPALWNILSQTKKISNIIGWWTTHPAEKIHGVMVDETFAIARQPASDPWLVAENSITPASVAEDLNKCRVHPQKISEALLRSLVPKLYEIDLSSDIRISAIAKILAEDLTNLNVTLQLMAEEPWDFTSVYLIGLDSLSHQGIDYREPALSLKSSRDIELYGELVDRAYELYDTWVGKLVEAAGKNTTIIIASDHGFYHDHRKPTTIGIEATAPCAYHAPMGSLIISGPEVRQNFKIKHASILDICPTILNLLDVPIGRDMQGHILSEAFTSLPEKKRIPSWDERYNQENHLGRFLSKLASADEVQKVDGAQKLSGLNARGALSTGATQHFAAKIEFRKKSKKPSTETTTAALRQLVALGYLQELPTNHEATVKEAHVTQLLHRALSYLSNEQLHYAIPLLEQARQQAPSRTDILSVLASAYLLMDESRRAAANFKQLVRSRRRDATKAAQELWALLEKKDISAKRSVSENWALRRLLARMQVDEDALQCTIALANWHAYHKTGDRDFLISFAKKNPHDFFMAQHAGQACLTSGLQEDGFALLRKSASWNLDEPEALVIMAENENFSRAEALAREALDRNPLDAASWLALATALVAQSQWKEAEKAAKHSSKSSLRRSKACHLLAEIALKGKNDRELAARYQKISERAAKRLKKAICKPSIDSNHQNFKPFFTRSSSSSQPLNPSTPHLPIVVSGLPRSGTSLLMQMLSAGGMEIFTDDQRALDEHNPRGYFEHEKIKNIASDISFLNEATGKVSKIVIPLLWELPENFKGNILWIRRNLKEVITSQKKMAGLEAPPEALLKAYLYYEEKTFELIASREWPVLELTHADVLADPKKSAEMINNFLGGQLDVEAMAKVVEPSLHRVRSGKK
ncbi:MAG: alkaline phosphatase family protein [Chthoniobacterales bacterium]